MLDSFTIIYSVCAGYFLQRVSGVHRVRASPVLATGAAPSAPRPGTRSDPARTQPGYRSVEPNKKQKTKTQQARRFSESFTGFLRTQA